MKGKNWQQSIVDFFDIEKRRNEQAFQKIDQYELLSISQLMTRITDQDIEIDNIKKSELHWSF